MTTPGSSTTRTTRAAIKDLLKGRTQVAEKLAEQLDKWEQAKEAVSAAQARTDVEAAAARVAYQKALDAGWSATELTGAGLKPPAPPRKRGGIAHSAAPATQLQLPNTV